MEEEKEKSKIFDRRDAKLFTPQKKLLIRLSGSELKRFWIFFFCFLILVEVSSEREMGEKKEVKLITVNREN
jgi:hypothetical protein